MILDATAGYRMMWFNKHDKETIYIDKRKKVKPNIQALWQYLPFPNNIFDIVLWDPPHTYSGPHGIFREKFGVLVPSNAWISEHYRAFKEFFRVLKKGGSLILKWNDHSKPLRKILGCTTVKPLFGQISQGTIDTRSRTYWLLFRNDG